MPLTGKTKKERLTMKKAVVWGMILISLMGLACCARGEGTVIPELTIAQRPIPENEAMEFLKRMKIGWNLGNTFDATHDGFIGNDLEIEKYWCGYYTTQAMITAVKAAGFNTIRIPVSWHNHITGEDFTINPAWMDRVQQVVDYAMAEGMYIIINSHHDCGKNFYYPSNECYENSEKYLTAVWKQIAERFRDYDEHLIMEAMNEPRLINTNLEWIFDPNSSACLEAADCINRLNQAFVDTVRATGGCNETRYLAVTAYDAAPYQVTSDYFVLPQDPAENRIIVSAHAYTPYSFALDGKGSGKFEPSMSQRNEIGMFMNSLYDRFIVNGIPVMLDEFGAQDKKNLQDRVNFCAFYVATASARNIPCCWWDNGNFSATGEKFGLLNRQKAAIAYPDLVAALMRYAGYDALPAAQ